MMELEFRGKSLGERLGAGVTRVDERAVNIEQNQFCHARKVSGLCRLARFLGHLFQNPMGGTGVAPVKSGVAPDFVQDPSSLVVRGN